MRHRRTLRAVLAPIAAEPQPISEASLDAVPPCVPHVEMLGEACRLVAKVIVGVPNEIQEPWHRHATGSYHMMISTAAIVRDVI